MKHTLECSRNKEVAERTESSLNAQRNINA
jgi:hypothetical protein